MAIAQDRLSTTLVEAPYLDPDSRDRSLAVDYEDGPLAINNVTLGLQYQPWVLTYNGTNFVLTPENVGPPVNILIVANIKYASFAFDRTGRPNICYTTNTDQCFLYWYDTVAQNFVTTAYPTVHHGMLSLDDKRLMEAGGSDIIFWYTRYVTDRYNLYTRKQGNRYTVEYPMKVDVYPYIYKAGMHKGLRGQVTLGTTAI